MDIEYAFNGLLQRRMRLASQVYPKKMGKRGQAGNPQEEGLSCTSAESNEFGMFAVSPSFLFLLIQSR